jgi:transposase-like protein
MRALRRACRGPVGFSWFRHTGGVNPCLPPVVSGRYLSFAVREDIALLCAQGARVREIARRIGRSPSTISRELRRNASTRTYNLDYKATLAQWHAERRARRPKVAKLVVNDQLRQYVQDRLSGAVRNMADTRLSARPGRNRTARTSRSVVIAAGCRGGAQNRSPTGSRWTSPMMSPCGSATRRSITFKAAVRSSVSWWPACAPGARFGLPGLGPGRRHGRMSRPRC